MSCSVLHFKMPETYVCMDCSLGHVPKNAVSVGNSLGLEKSYLCTVLIIFNVQVDRSLGYRTCAKSLCFLTGMPKNAVCVGSLRLWCLKCILYVQITLSLETMIPSNAVYVGNSPGFETMTPKMLYTQETHCLSVAKNVIYLGCLPAKTNQVTRYAVYVRNLLRFDTMMTRNAAYVGSTLGLGNMMPKNVVYVGCFETMRPRNVVYVVN